MVGSRRWNSSLSLHQGTLLAWWPTTFAPVGLSCRRERCPQPGDQHQAKGALSSSYRRGATGFRRNAAHVEKHYKRPATGGTALSGLAGAEGGSCWPEARQTPHPAASAVWSTPFGSRGFAGENAATWVNWGAACRVCRFIWIPVAGFGVGLLAGRRLLALVARRNLGCRYRLTIVY